MEIKTWPEFKKELLKDKKVMAEYKKLEPEFKREVMLIEILKKQEKSRLKKNASRKEK